MDNIKVLIGKQVTVWYAIEGAKYHYSGKLLFLDSTTVIVDDIKEGAIVLPFQACQIKAGDLDG